MNIITYLSMLGVVVLVLQVVFVMSLFFATYCQFEVVSLYNVVKMNIITCFSMLGVLIKIVKSYTMHHGSGNFGIE